VTHTAYYTVAIIHRLFEVWFLAFLTLHIGMTLTMYKLDLRATWSKLRERRGTKIHSLRIVQRVSSWLIILFALAMIIPGLNGYEIFAQQLEDVVDFSWHKVFDFFLTWSLWHS
jgi:hypothetical protein